MKNWWPAGIFVFFFMICAPLQLSAQNSADTEAAPDNADTEAVESEEATEEGAALEEESDAFVNEVLSEAEEANSPGASDYEEISAMRVLERRLMPSGQDSAPTQGESVVPFSARDPMGLSYSQAMRALMGTSSPIDDDDDLGMQPHRALSEAMRLVAQELEPYQGEQRPGKTLHLPFGIDCLKQKSVQEYLALFSSPGSKTIKIWLQRSGKWQAMITRVLREEGMPEDLLYLAMIESGFKTRVKSPAAAGGMWQFIPSTGIDMGLTINAYVDERFDPEKSTRAAAQYLKKQFTRYNTWPLAMAAYNGGPGTVNVAIDRYNATDYFKLVEYGAMYDETRRYVPKILAAALIGKNPKVFGFEGLKYDEPWAYDEVEVESRTKLQAVAKAARCDVEILQELNPELLQDYTPPDVKNYKLRIPAGSLQGFVERYDDLQKSYASDSESVALKFGQSLEHLAEQIAVPARVLRALNGYSSRELAPYGSEILVPKGSSKKLKQAKTTDKEEEKPVVLVSSDDFKFSDKARYFYTTQRGDKLSALAKFLGIPKSQIALWNDLDPSAKLRPDMHLQVFVPKTADLSGIILQTEEEVRILIKGSQAFLDWQKSRRASKKPASNSVSTDRRGNKVYTVKKGDSLSKIASKQNTTVKNLLKWNKLKESDTIRVGMKIIVKK